MVTVKIIQTSAPRIEDTVPSDTTLRELLESHGVNYTVGVVKLDSAVLQAGDLDKTFEDFNVTGACYLSVIVKADNAAHVQVLGDAAVIVSDMDLETVKTAKKYRPASLLIKDKDGNTLFTCGLAKGSGEIGPKGIFFGENAVNGKAAVTVYPIGGEKAKEKIADEFGSALLFLRKLETSMEAVKTEIAQERADVLAMIG